VTIIGDHTDYNEGLSLPMAIDLATEANFAPEPGSFLVGLESDQFPEPWEILLSPDGAPSSGATTPLPPEANLAAALLRTMHPPVGGRMTVRSGVPVGAGLSSSAAFSVAVLLALGHPADAVTLARLNQAAEAAAGSRVGLLDPLCIVDARPGHALSIDFASPLPERYQVPIPPGAAFVLVHSEASRVLGGSPYATRRAECEMAANQIGRALGRCDLGDLSALRDPVLRRRARHVITECTRVREVERLLARGNLAAVGAVMSDGHRSLAEDYRVSIPEVDRLVARLQGTPGVLGARMSGGGFGGCVIALCDEESPALDPTSHAPHRAWQVTPSGGATVRSID
jgi:galactokinase